MLVGWRCRRITVIGDTGYSLLFPFCTFDGQLREPIVALGMATVQLIVLIRVSAMYGHNKILLRFLVCFFTCQMVAVIVATVIILKMPTPALYYEFLSGCWVSVDTTNKDMRYRYIWWIPFACFDGILFLLTIAKALHYRDNFNPTIRLLARDSIVYFVIMFCTCIVGNMVIFTSPVAVASPAEWIGCIAVSRMMMNIRGLLFNDPLGSQGVKFSTISFRNRDCAEGDPRCTGTEQNHAGGV